MREFWDKVDVRGPAECWLWKGGVKEHRAGRDYGVITFQGQKWRTHRLAFVLTKGPIPDGLDVLHSCDTPRCCNPKHLRAGTHQDNMREMVERKRRRATAGAAWYRAHPPSSFANHLGTSLPGEANPGAILTDNEVSAIKAEIRRVGGRRGICVELARQYGVTGDTVQKIKQGKNWSHIQ